MRTTTTLLVSILFGACAQPEADPFISDALGRCTYVNGFNDRNECKEYLGSNWTEAAMRENCDRPVPRSDPGVLELDLGCDRSDLLGVCYIDAGTVESNTLFFLNGPDYDCGGLAVGCSFAGGQYEPAAACGGEDPLPPEGTTVFEPFQQVCAAPLDGEPAGQSENGQVCTWEAISASTEEGRRYIDYASCDPVYTQRPYYAAPRETGTAPDDPRLTDPTYQAEFAWVNAQVEASACVCCHMDSVAPDGPSVWWLEQEGIWVDAMSDEGVGMMAGWVNSDSFGAFDPADNNGFDRSVTGMPTTDSDRMRAFFEGELARRGVSRDDLADAAPFGGPLYDQLVYEPSACPDSVSIGPNGELNWVGGRARYIYVMEPGASAPGVPPNLDLPEGTLWRVDVAPTADPVASGLRYGEIPDGATQAFPVQGAPAPLRSGQEVYLYVSADMYQPVTRCLTTVP